MRSFSVLRAGIATCGALLICAAPAAAQIDITGVWQQPGNGIDTLVDVRPGMTAAFRGGQYEDMWERCCGGGAGRGGPTAVDFIGIPLNEAGRARAMAHDDSLWEVPEHQCQPHHAAYAYWGVGSPTISTELNESGQLIAYHIEGTFRRMPREIWMDGRPHPPEYARHTWAGFTTGEWHGNTLVAKTTHLKKGWVRRNGAPTSDEATLLTYFTRHGDVLTVTVFVDDPLYYSEPYIKSTDYSLAPRIPTASFANTDNPGTCYGHTTVVFSDEHPVPHWLPGQNPSVGERATALHIPVEATLGFAESAYPEFIDKIKAWRDQNPIGKPAAPAPKGGSSAR